MRSAPTSAPTAVCGSPVTADHSKRFCSVESASSPIRGGVGEIQDENDIDNHTVRPVAYTWANARWQIVDVDNQQLELIDES